MMMIKALAALVLLAGASPAKLKNPISKDAMDTVQVCSDHSGDIATNFRARSIATQMFAGIGVGIEWYRMDSCPANALRVSFSTDTPTMLMPRALAYAFPYEGTHIVIFYDRVQAAVADPNLVPVLMAHVLAHEITHVLEGVARHSAEGVLKAHWTLDDYSKMSFKPLKFADEDIALIHQGLEQRAARHNAEQYAIAQHPAGGE